MLKSKEALMVIIDVQGKLARLMHESEKLFDGLQRAIKGMRALGVPILWVEQNPKGLGPTVPEISELLPDIKPISKMTFSCLRDEGFAKALKQSGRKQILLTGIETHVCVYQTALDLLDMGYEVEIIVDAVSSRTRENKEIGLQKMRDAGAGITCTETVFFEMLERAEGEKFKRIIKIIK